MFKVEINDNVRKCLLCCINTLNFFWRFTSLEYSHLTQFLLHLGPSSYISVSIDVYISLNKFITNVNLFVPNAPFLYPLKTSENRKVRLKILLMRIPFSFDLVEMRTGVIPSGINIKINNENIKTMYEICSKLKK